MSSSRSHLKAVIARARALRLTEAASLDLLEPAQYSFSGQIGAEESFLKATGRHLSHQKLFLILLQDYLHESFPLLSSLEAAGQSDFDIQARVKEGHTFLEGVVRIYETALNIPGLFSVSGLALSLPFELVYPSAPPAAEPQNREEALLTIKRLQKGHLLIEDLSIPFIVSQNSLRLLKAIDLRLYGSELRLPST